MSAPQKSDDSERDVARIILRYYERVESGESVDLQAFVDQHSDYAEELHSFLNNLQALNESLGQQTHTEQGSLRPIKNQRTDPEFMYAGTSIEYIGEYRVLEEISRGGMGIVFRAEQEKLKRPVALKMILAGRLARTSDVERFQLEARAAARLKHPNIVRVHEIGTHQGHHFYTMDLIESESLADRLRDSSLAPREAAKLVATLAHATEHAHANGVLHRDLKPANVLIDPEGTPHITDFGLAKTLGTSDGVTQCDLTQSGQILGTPGYLSPEQAMAHHDLVGVETDVYSLGAILYAALSGRAPFVAESIPEALQQVIREEPPPLRILTPSVPKDLRVVTHKCLDKDPSKRYGSAKELHDDLNRFLSGSPIHARPIGPFARTYRWCRRNPAVASLTIVATLALIAACVVSLNFAVFYKQTANRENLAKTDAVQRLYDSLLTEVGAHRTSEQSGSKTRGLAAIRRAAEIEPNLTLRNEAIGMLAKLDMTRGRSWRGYPMQTNAIAFDHDLGRYAIGDAQGGVSIRRTHDGVELFSLPANGQRTSWEIFEFSNTGKYLAVGYRGYECWVWDLANREPILKILHGNFADGFAFSPADDDVAIGLTNREVHVYSLDEKQEKFGMTAAGSVFHIRYSPDGRTIATSVLRERCVHLFDAGDGKLKMTLRHDSGLTRRVSWHPNGDSLVAAVNESLIQWNVSDEEPTRIYQHYDVLDNVVFHPTGRFILSGGWGGKTQVWDATRGNRMLTTSGIPIRLSSDGTRLAAQGGSDQLTIMNLDDDRVIESVAIGDWQGVAFHPSGRYFAANSKDGVSLFDSESKRQLGKIAGHANGAVFGHDGKRIYVSGSTGFRSYPIAYGGDGASVAMKIGPAKKHWDVANTGEIWRFGKDRMVVASYIGKGFLFDVKRNRGFEFGPQSGMKYVAADPLTRFVATGSWKSKTGIKIWDGESGELVHEIESQEMACRPRFSPDGQRLIVGDASAYQVFRVADWERESKLPRENNGANLFGSSEFAPDRPEIALNHSRYRTQLRHAESLELLAEFIGFEQGILGYSPNGKHLFVNDVRAGVRTLCIWNLETLNHSLGDLGLAWASPHQAVAGDTVARSTERPRTAIPQRRTTQFTPTGLNRHPRSE